MFASVTVEGGELVWALVVPVVLIIVFIVLSVVFFTYIFRVIRASHQPHPSPSRQPTHRRAATQPPPSRSPGQLPDLLGTAGWISNQLTPELLDAPAPDAVERWSVERPRVDSTALTAKHRHFMTQNLDWKLLGEAIEELAVVLDANVMLRSEHPTDTQAIADSTALVESERMNVSSIVASLVFVNDG